MTKLTDDDIKRIRHHANTSGRPEIHVSEIIALCDEALATRSSTPIFPWPRNVIEAVADALDKHLGDSDLLHIESDAWLRERAPVQWACSQLNQILQNRATPSESVQTITVPQGWKLVPVEPTEAMLDALGSSPWIVDSDTKVVGNEVVTTRREFRDQRYVIDGWIAMLAAAPEAAK